MKPEVQLATHPMLADAVELDKSVGAMKKRIEKQAHQIWKDLTGIELPRLETYRDGGLGQLADASRRIRLRSQTRPTVASHHDPG